MNKEQVLAAVKSMLPATDTVLIASIGAKFLKAHGEKLVKAAKRVGYKSVDDMLSSDGRFVVKTNHTGMLEFGRRPGQLFALAYSDPSICRSRNQIKVPLASGHKDHCR